MGGVVLHGEISSDGIQEVLCYSENLHVISEEPIIEIEERIPVETPPTTNTSDLTGFAISSEPLAELDGDVFSEPAKKFFYDNAASVLLNTTSVIAIKLSCAKGTAKVAYSAFADVVDAAMKSLGTDYFKRFVSEKVSADIDKLFISNKWAEFSKQEIALVWFKILRQAFIDGSTCIATKIAIASGWAIQDADSSVSKWPGCIIEITAKVLIKDSVQDLIAVPRIDPIMAPYTDLRVGAIVAEFSKSLFAEYMFKIEKKSSENTELLGYKLIELKICSTIVKHAVLAGVKYTSKWAYKKYLKEHINSCIDCINEYTGLNETYPMCGRYAKVLASSVFTTLPNHIVRFMLA